MSKNVAVFVDVANLYYSARGQDVDVDYVALLKAATKGRDLIRAYAYSGLDPENENQRKFIDFLGKNGYKVLTKDIRKFGDGRVKANLDIELVVDLFRLADRMDIAVIVSGDGDFAPAIRALQDKGVRCEVISFRPNTSSDLMAVTDEFTDIMKIAGIGRGTKDAKADGKRMSAPEMPAKEVVPEFGFREASPGVAKAALAALREGRGTSGDRGRRRGRSAASSSDETEAAPAAAGATANGNGAHEADGEGEPRRRRRRRGGRGRGRGRGRGEQSVAEETTGAPEGEGEIGWVEVDDLSQLEELDGVDLTSDREYTFEEADEATLAELGINAGEVTAESQPKDDGEDAGAEGAKKPARRTRARKAAAKPAASEAAEDGAESEPKKPARRRATSSSRSSTGTTSSSRTARSRAKKDDGDEAGEAATAEKPKARTRSTGRSRAKSGAAKSSDGDAEAAEAKPAARRSRATKSKDAGEGDATEQPEGIWQRFRSARGTRQSG